MHGYSHFVLAIYFNYVIRSVVAVVLMHTSYEIEHFSGCGHRIVGLRYVQDFYGIKPPKIKL